MFDGRSVHAPELWTVRWNVGGDLGVVCSSFTGMHGAVCRSLWTLRDVSCLRGGRKGGEEIFGCLLSGW